LPVRGAGFVTVESLNRTLEQELNALLRGAILECLACGEFVMRLPDGGLFCPECGSGLDAEAAAEPAHSGLSGSGGR
jgi:uncharacterized Zn finger protein (UPF0148 family)